jgi:hypothetical protein
MIFRMLREVRYQRRKRDDEEEKEGRDVPLAVWRRRRRR